VVTISSVKARDIMQTQVITLSPSTPIESAVETFEDLHISGAPVVDERGTIVGMLSAFDIAKSEHMQGGAIQTGSGDYEGLETEGDRDDDEDDEPLSFDEVILSMNDFSPTTTGRTRVGEWMTHEIVSVGPECGLRAICRLMVKEHVHRVPVVKNGRLVGIISTLDIVRCIAREGESSAVKVPNLVRPSAKRVPVSRPASVKVASKPGASRSAKASRK
jgi:predicted transcriptional regulator